MIQRAADKPFDAVFLDTAALIAISTTRDGLHAAAMKVREQLSHEGCALFTSQWALAEYLGSMAQTPTRLMALRLFDSVLASPKITTVAADPALVGIRLGALPQQAGQGMVARGLRIDTDLPAKSNHARIHR